MTDPYVAALLHEREKCIAAARWDRVAEVDKQLAMRGVAVEAVVEAPPENAARPRGRPRKESR